MDWKCESANQTFHRWHLVASQSRKVAGRERGPRERPGGETVLADSEGTSRENRVATTRERRGGSQKERVGPSYVSAHSSSHALASSCSSKMHLEMDESGAVQWRLLWFCRSLTRATSLIEGFE